MIGVTSIDSIVSAPSSESGTGVSVGVGVVIAAGKVSGKVVSALTGVNHAAGSVGSFPVTFPPVAPDADLTTRAISRPGMREVAERAAGALRRLTVPVVLVDRAVPAAAAAACAPCDHALGMRAATRHLLELGHRRFALITGGPGRPARERRRAVEEELAAAGDGARCAV